MAKELVCPKCGYPQKCGCSACKDKLPEGIKPYKWSTILYNTGEIDESGFLGGGQIELITCANCGFKASVDYWMDEEYKQFKEEYNRLDKKEST